MQCSVSMQCHMHSPLPETFLKPEGCNLLLLGFMLDITATMWCKCGCLVASPTLFYAESTIAGRVVRTNPTNLLWIRH